MTENRIINDETLEKVAGGYEVGDESLFNCPICNTKKRRCCTEACHFMENNDQKEFYAYYCMPDNECRRKHYIYYLWSTNECSWSVYRDHDCTDLIKKISYKD